MGESTSSERMDDYLSRFVKWSRAEPSVLGVVHLGSTAHGSTKDALSDLDLMVITTQPRRLSSWRWLESIDPPPLFSWAYASPVGGQTVLQAIYEGPLVVDIALVSGFQAGLLGLAVAGMARTSNLRRLLPVSVTLQLDAWVAITSRGTKILLDRHGLAKRMTAAATRPTATIPTEAAYLNAVRSSFGLILWESKQLVRRELWMALGTVDQQLKESLLTLLEWHAVASNSEIPNTWYGGRRLHEWSNSRWVSALNQSWPSYDVEGAWDALFATFDLIGEVAKETAQALGYRYPTDDEARVREWITARRASSA